jgi:CheY-like chemotaxis protein
MSQSAGGASILLVEDDDQIRRMVRSLLSSENYTVIEASNGIEGLQKAQESDSAIDLLPSDMLLPELSGYDLAVRLRELYPRIRVILMTGYIEGEIVQRCVEELNALFLDKPFQPAQLRQTVRDALSGPSAQVARS